MAEKAFKVGEAPWEVSNRGPQSKKSEFKVGEAPWEIAQGGSQRISETLDPVQKEESLTKGLIRGGLKILPTAGGIAGGLIGTVAGAPTGPGAIATGVGGAALGTAAGEAYRQLGERYLLGESDVNTSEDAAKKIGMAGAEGAAAQAVGNVAGKGLGFLAKTGPVKTVTGAIGRGASKVGEALTGIPKKAIETYSKYAPEISKMSKEAGGDVQVAADQIRKTFNKSIQGARKALNSEISKGLEKNAAKSVEVQPILTALAKEQEKVNPQLYPEVLEQMDDVIKKISGLSKDGKLSLKDAQETKQFLQDIGKTAYQKGGQIFQYGKATAKGGKAAAGEARSLIAREAPEIAKANEDLYKLHQIEKLMNRNMLAEGKSASGLLSAGSGVNTNNAKYLSELGDITGTNMVGEAEKLASMKAFSDAPIMPWDYTGKAAGRLIGGAGTGYLIDGNEGAMVGAALTSPLALKGLIRSGRGVGNATGFLMQNPGAQNLVGRGLINIQDYIRKRKSEGATDVQIEQELGAVE